MNPVHEQDQQVAGEDVGEQSDGERDDPDELRDHLDKEDGDRGASADSGGEPALQVLDQAVPPYALHLVEDEDGQREDERH